MDNQWNIGIFTYKWITIGLQSLSSPSLHAQALPMIGWHDRAQAHACLSYLRSGNEQVAVMGMIWIWLWPYMVIVGPGMPIWAGFFPNPYHYIPQILGMLNGHAICHLPDNPQPLH